MKKKEKIKKISDKDVKQVFEINDIDFEISIKKVFTKKLLQEYKNNDLLKECFPLEDEEIISNFVQIEKVINEETQCKLVAKDVCPFDGYHLSVSRNSDNNFLDFHYKICKKLEHQILYRENKKNFLYNSYALLKKFPVLSEEKETTSSKNDFLKLFFKIWKDNESQGIYIYGKQGVGKTHLFKLICSEILSSKKTIKTVALINLVDLVETTKSSFSDKQNSKYLKLMDAIVNADYLFFDDLGAEYATEWFYSNVLLNILDNRLTTNKATFFNSNLKLEEYKNKIVKNCKNKDGEIAKRIIIRIERLVKKRIMEIKDLKYL